MMAELDPGFLESLKNLRGEFQNSKGGRIGNRVLAHIFSTLFPGFFLLFFLFGAELHWPLAKDQWLYLSFAFVSLMVGVFIHRSINSHFIFDDEGIKELRPDGRLKQQVRWKEISQVDFRESRGIKTFLIKSNDSVMQVEYYKSISDAIALDQSE